MRGMGPVKNINPKTMIATAEPPITKYRPSLLLPSEAPFMNPLPRNGVGHLS
jgi:hypothetical protein